MRPIMLSLVFCGALFVFGSALADPPVISYNVTVAQGVSPSQCPSSYRGDADPATGIDVSRVLGEDDVEGPGVQSCTGCAINAGNCVCKTCYSFYSGD